MSVSRPSSVLIEGYGMGLQLHEPTWFGPLPHSFGPETGGNGVILSAWPAGDVENLFLLPDTDSGPVELPMPHERRGSVTLGSSSDTQRFGRFHEYPDVPLWLVGYGAFRFTMPDALHKIDAGVLEITRNGLEPDEFVSFDGPYVPGLGPTLDELIASYQDIGHAVLDAGTVEMGRGTARRLRTRYEHEGRRWRQVVHLCTDGITGVVRGQYLDQGGDEGDDGAIEIICDAVVSTLRLDEGVTAALADVLAGRDGDR